MPAARPNETMPAAPRSSSFRSTVVMDRHFQGVLEVGETHLYCGRVRMLEHIRERLLNDAVGGCLQALGKLARGSIDEDVDVEPGSSRLVGKHANLLEGRWRRSVRALRTVL